MRTPNGPRLRTFLVLGLAFIMPALAGCPSRPIAKSQPQPVQEFVDYKPQNLERDVDILFMIDNSQSMREEQTNLAKNFGVLIDVLETLPGGLPNVHIGVVSSDLGTDPYRPKLCEKPGGDGGRLQSAPRVAGCQGPQGAYIEYLNGGATKNYQGDIKDVFRCIAQLGTSGCGFEHQLDSVRKALAGCERGQCEVPENQGFLRSEALLAVILITDEDDCSAQNAQLYDTSQTKMSDPLGPLTSFRCFEFGITCDINDRTVQGVRNNCEPGGSYLFTPDYFVGELKKLKPPGRIIFTAIAGQTSPVSVGLDAEGNPDLEASCRSENGEAAPAIRVKKVTDAFGENGGFISICQGDFGPAIQTIADKIKSALAEQCIGGRLPDPAHPDCHVTDIQDYGSAQAVETPIPPCGGSAGTPCWKVEQKASCASGYEMVIDRGGEQAKPNTTAEIRCATVAGS